VPFACTLGFGTGRKGHEGTGAPCSRASGMHSVFERVQAEPVGQVWAKESNNTSGVKLLVCSLKTICYQWCSVRVQQAPAAVTTLKHTLHNGRSAQGACAGCPGR